VFSVSNGVLDKSSYSAAIPTASFGIKFSPIKHEGGDAILATGADGLINQMFC